MANISLTAPKLGRKRDAPKLAELLCACAKEIDLNDDTCKPENRQKLEKILGQECSQRQLWTINQKDNIVGLLILNNFTVCGVKLHEIRYIAVDPDFRCKGIGPTLIRYTQAKRGVRGIQAEASNDHSKHVLMKCGFEPTGECSARGHPKLFWQRASRRHINQ